jgi:hypothetical protein
MYPTLRSKLNINIFHLRGLTKSHVEATSQTDIIYPLVSLSDLFCASNSLDITYIINFYFIVLPFSSIYFNEFIRPNRLLTLHAFFGITYFTYR